MPSGPPELHIEWTEKGPYPAADANAIHFLENAGYELTDKWFWVPPKGITLKTMGEEEYSAMCYLCWEWDFGGLIE